MTGLIVFVKEKVGQGQPLTKGYNNAISPHNCYYLDAISNKIVLKAYREFVALYLSQLAKLYRTNINKN